MVKPTTWKAPNWDSILLEQGYVPADAVVVDDKAVPVGPGDGLVRQVVVKAGPSKKYVGHTCPVCKEPVSDEVVKQLDEKKRALARCPGCAGYFTIYAKASTLQLTQCD